MKSDSKKLLRHLFFALIILSSASIAFVQASLPPLNEIIVDTFSGESDGLIPKGWKHLDFPRKPRRTLYTVQQEGGNYFLKADSVESASALYKTINEDLSLYPVLSWSWKVEGVVRNGNERKKEGDDYAARVYVTFEYEPDKISAYERIKHRFIETVYGIAPPGNAINYIWANKLAKNEAVPNPFTDQVIMVAQESGTGLVGKWVREERNIYEDYRKFFKAEPPRITGIVVMTDTDNTRDKIIAYYDDIVLKRKQ